MMRLASAERRTLEKHETTIERGLKTFRDVGAALMAIREDRLYRADYESFNAYCKDRWSFGESRARQLIAAAKTADSVTNVTLPNEATARELAKVPEEQRADVLDSASKAVGDGPLTAKAIREASVVHCPNCGSTEADDDGDCAKCHEPDIEIEATPEDYEEIGAAPTNEDHQNCWLQKTATEAASPDTTSQEVVAMLLEGIAAIIRESGPEVAAAKLENQAEQIRAEAAQ